LFPEGWSKKKIKRAIEHVANNPTSTTPTINHLGVHTGDMLHGSYDGVKLMVPTDLVTGITGGNPL
jgi:hypothetical protein